MPLPKRTVFLVSIVAASAIAFSARDEVAICLSGGVHSTSVLPPAGGTVQPTMPVAQRTAEPPQAGHRHEPPQDAGRVASAPDPTSVPTPFSPPAPLAVGSADLLPRQQRPLVRSPVAPLDPQTAKLERGGQPGEPVSDRLAVMASKRGAIAPRPKPSAKRAGPGVPRAPAWSSPGAEGYPFRS